MNKLTTKIVSISFCAALCLGSVGAVYAVTGEKEEEPKATTATTMQAQEKDAKEVSKDETVYVLAGANGSVQKIIVSDWIKNSLSTADIADVSNLSDIENVKGDETYTVNGDSMKVWDAQGNDIYYQGNIEKELPVGLSVSYKLDGKDISAEEIAGKSGKVTIRFDYENNQYEKVTIDGKQEKIYVPFAMLTGMLLDNDTFRNVEVSNGKLINDGDRSVVVGIAFPGLQENLAINEEKLDIPDYVEITADVTNFEFGMTMTIATNEIFNELDTTKLDSADDLTGALTDLTDAMDQLLDGSSALYDGLSTLLDNSDTLVDGINQLANGASSLKDGAGSLDDGAVKLEAGLETLSSGLSELSANNTTLNEGAKQVFETLLATANTQLAEAGLSVSELTIDNYEEVLNGVIASLDETEVYNQALQQVTAAVEGNRSLIKEKVTEAVKAQVTAQVISTATGMSVEDYSAAVSAGLVGADVQAAIESAVQSQMKTKEIKKTIAENVELQIAQAISENMASDAVQAQLTAASEGAQAIITLKASLDSYNTFYVGLQTYTAGVASAASGSAELYTGASDLQDGTESLKSGASTLYDGVVELQNGAPALVDGITQLKDGAMQLSDGLTQFNEDGIRKIVDAVDGDLDGLVTRLKATVDVSKNYRNFAGISDEMDGQVKFIYRTDEINAE